MAWYDITGTLSDVVMAGAAVYASLAVKTWVSQENHKNISQFAEAMNDVEKQLLKYYLHIATSDDEIDEYLVIIMSLPLYQLADDKINVLISTLAENQKQLIKTRYKEFKENRGRSWIEAIKHSNDPDYEYHEYEDFYKFLRNELISSRPWILRKLFPS